mgnify:CR=1 FL=1
MEKCENPSINTKETCLEWCQNQSGLTGCEYIINQGNQGCYGHREQVSRGNGVANHWCWITSQGIFFVLKNSSKQNLMLPLVLSFCTLLNKHCWQWKKFFGVARI